MCHLYIWLGICCCVKPARAAGSQQTHVCTYTPGSSNHAHQLSRALQRLLSLIVVHIVPAYHFMLFHSWQGMDLSQGIAAVVPDWDSVRLLAPHAELRLLACGQASLIAPHRLRSPIVCPSMHLLSDNDFCHCLSSNTLLLLCNLSGFVDKHLLPSIIGLMLQIVCANISCLRQWHLPSVTVSDTSASLTNLPSFAKQHHATASIIFSLTNICFSHSI